MLEHELGVHTRCYTSQVALVTYYCGSAATSGEEGDVYGSKQLLSLLGVLRDSPPAVRASAIRGLLALGPGLTRAGSRWQQQAQQQNDNSWYSGLDDDYEEDEELWGWAEEEAEEGDDEALAGSVQQLAGWDGQPLPQLIFRCHVYGDMDLSGHTFVIAMQPDGMVFDVYQSFIGAYTLHEYLYDNPKALSYEEMVQFLEDMQAIEAAETWNRQIDQTYCSGSHSPAARAMAACGWVSRAKRCLVPPPVTAVG